MDHSLGASLGPVPWRAGVVPQTVGVPPARFCHLGPAARLVLLCPPDVLHLLVYLPTLGLPALFSAPGVLPTAHLTPVGNGDLPHLLDQKSHLSL